MNCRADTVIVTIQSVLDVKDDNPLPKGSNPPLNFNRSILILTPERALKFTAMTQDRHYVWLTALSFLSHSPLGINDLATLPPLPQEEYVPPRSQPSSLRRNKIRDSIQVSKNKGGRPGFGGIRSFTTGTSIPSSVPQLPTHDVELYYGANEPISDAADPPNVPRFSAHSRKRSNTAPRPPPSAFRSFSGGIAQPPPSTYSGTTGSSEIYAPSVGGTGMHSTQSSFSHRTSEASGPRPAALAVNNFFDAVGTVRMEAFVDRQHEPRQRQSYRTRQGRKKDMSYWGGGPPSEGSVRPSVDGSEGSGIYRSEDPFRGF